MEFDRYIQLLTEHSEWDEKLATPETIKYFVAWIKDSD